MPNSTSNITVLIITHLLISLLLFTVAISISVFGLRKPLRKYKPVDLAIFDRLEPLVSNRNNRFMLAITFLGKHQFLIPANLLLIAYFLLIANRSSFSIRVAAIALSSLALMFILKYLFHRKRPLSPLLNAAKGLSFPSGHAIMAVTFFGLLIYCIDQSAWPLAVQFISIVLLVILIILIGFSRIYLRVHYASDVLAGFIIGVLWLLISLSVLNNLIVFL